MYNAKVLFRDVKICKLILCEAETLLFLFIKVISFSFLNRIVACMLSMAKGVFHTERSRTSVGRSRTGTKMDCRTEWWCFGAFFS